jgi:broad specificity phosphatase PhoE
MGPYDDAIVQRAEVATEWLRSRPEEEIAVVTHRITCHLMEIICTC